MPEELHRYMQVANTLGYYTVAKFAKEIDVKYITLYTAVDRGSGVSDEIADKIVTRFPQVNKDWLMTGKGEMLIGGLSTVNDSSADYTPTEESPSMVSRLLELFGYIPEHKRTTAAQRLLAQMILEEHKRNEEKQKLIDELRKKQDEKE